MIIVVIRCLNRSKIEKHNWHWHFAFLHFKKYKNTYINGKPLKWWHRFKNGDVIETVETPKGIESLVAAIVAIVAFGAVHPVITTIGVLAIAGLATAGISAGISALTQGGTSFSGATASKEYSSSTQPEIRGANNDISTGIIPVLFGKTQQTPVYGQLPYRLVGDGSSTNKLCQYFIPNYNNVVYSDYRLGETSLNDYSADYVAVQTQTGSSTFIGFENVKAHDVNEELTYNDNESINQTANHSYNQTTTSTEIDVEFLLRFSNVDISNWAVKTFRLIVNVLNGTLSPVALTQDFTINSGDLVFVSSGVYTYTGTRLFTQAITELVSTSIYPLTDTRGNSVEVNNGLNSLLVSQDVTLDSYADSVVLNLGVNRYIGATSEVVRTSPPNTVECDVIISFPQGLYTVQNDGSRTNRSVKINIDFKLNDDIYQPISDATSLFIRDLEGIKQPLSSSTTTVSGSIVTMNSPVDMNVADQLFFRNIGMVLPAGRYSIRVRSADFADKTNFDIGSPYCSEIQFRVNTPILDTNILPKVNQINFLATAYAGLSGSLKKFNYTGEARIPVWNGSNWNTISTSQNPAAIIRHLLTDNRVNPRAESLNYIDNDSLVEFYNWCAEQGYKASGIVTEETKISEVIGNILANCQAAMIPMFNGKHTFVIDKPDKIPVGLFNQHNSFDFKWSPTIGRQTEAVRVSFLNNQDYTTDELTVYWYDDAVHEEPELGKTDDDYKIIKKEYKYVNDRSSVLKIASYELETLQKKRNSFEFSVNLEALNMLLLDRCYVTNSANMQNESTGLIRQLLIENGNITGFKLPADIDIPEDAKIIIRSLDFENQRPVINIYDVLNSGNTDIVEIEPISNSGIIRGAGEITGIGDKWHYDGDLFTVGQATIYDCTVVDIKYNEGNTATIMARDY